MQGFYSKFWSINDPKYFNLFVLFGLNIALNFADLLDSYLHLFEREEGYYVR